MKNTLLKERQDGRLGFTLIEIMLVIAVIGILALVSVPKYQVITDHYKLESSAQIVVGQLRYAKQLAMDQREDIYVALDSNRVEVLDENRNYGGAQAFDSGVSFDISSAESNGLNLESGKAKGLPYVLYDARGFIDNSPESGRDVKIVLSSARGNRSVSIVVDIETGNIVLEW